MRVWFLSLVATLALPAAFALAQGTSPPPPGTSPPLTTKPAAPAVTIAGPWSSFKTADGIAAAGLGTSGASLAFLCFPEVGFAMLYHSGSPFPASMLQAKSVHILFGELHDPKSGKGGSIVEGVVDPPIDPSSLLISGEGVDKMLALAEKAALDLRMAVLDGENIVQADNFSSAGSTAAIKQLKQTCGKS